MHALELEDYNNIPFLHAPSYFCIPRDALQSAVLAVVEMSVRLSVTHSLALCRNAETYH